MRRWHILTCFGLFSMISPAILLGAAVDLNSQPLGFEPNRGQQVDSAVKYFARGSEYDVWLTGRGMVLRSRNRDAAPLRMDFRGASAEARAATASDRLPGTVHYLAGNDPSQWRTGVPRF